MKDQIIAVIPARFASSRFPGKPLVKIAGKSLLQRTFENAKGCSLFDELIVATDDEQIKEHAESFGAVVVMTSPSCPTGSDRIAEALKKKKIDEQAIIFNVQGDLPLLELAVIEKMVQLLKDRPEDVMATAAVPIRNEEEAVVPSVVKCVLDQKSYALYFSRTLIPHSKGGGFSSTVPYLHHLGIYAFRYHFLKKYNSLPATPLQLIEDLEQLKVLEHGYKISVAVVESDSFGIDRPEDAARLEKLLCP